MSPPRLSTYLRALLVNFLNWLEMNKSLLAFLNLLADLIATEISQECPAKGEQGIDAFAIPNKSFGKECSSLDAENIGNVGPIPRFPTNSYTKYRQIPTKPQPRTYQKKEVSDENNRQSHS